jgi:hypothetical protein
LLQAKGGAVTAQLAVAELDLFGSGVSSFLGRPADRVAGNDRNNCLDPGGVNQSHGGRHPSRFIVSWNRRQTNARAQRRLRTMQAEMPARHAQRQIEEQRRGKHRHGNRSRRDENWLHDESLLSPNYPRHRPSRLSLLARSRVR